MKQINNCAYIDGQNLNFGMKSLGWSLDYQRFRVYLKEKYKIKEAYIFIGYIPENIDLYNSLQKAGYLLIFKPVLFNQDGGYKGNVDADLVLYAMIDYNNNVFDKALIVTSDGDFYSLVKYLYSKDKLEKVVSPHIDTCSTLLKKTAKEKICFLNNLKHKLEYKKKSTA